MATGTKNVRLPKVPVQSPEAVILERLAQLERIKKKVERLYAQRDRIETELRSLMAEGQPFPYDETRDAILVDNFKDKNVCFGHGPVRRYDIRICKRKEKP